jgi:iron complex outermembrane receptor protein
MMHRGVSLLVCLALVGTEARAQQPDSTRADTGAVQLEELEVVGSIVPAAGPGVGSGVPARVTTVTGAQIDAWEPRLLVDALATQAGISLYDDVGSAYKLNLSARGWNVGPVVGLPPGISVFLDGIRQNEPDAAEVNFDLLPMEHVERIELLAGNGSLLGPNSLGGAINLITRRGKGPLSGSLEASGGSYGAWSGEGSLAGSVGKGLNLYAGGGYDEEEGWREDTGGHTYNGLINLGRSGPTGGFRVQAMGAASYASTAGSLPYSIFKQDPSRNFTVGDFEDLDLIQVAGHGTRVFGASRGSISTYYRRHTAERFNVNQAPDNNVRSLTENSTVGGTLDWRLTQSAGSGSLSFRAGVDGAVNRVNVRLYEEDPLDPSNKTLNTDVRSPSWDLAGYAMADYRLGLVTLSGGARFDYLRIPFEDKLDPTADTVSTFSRLSPRAGVTVAVTPTASLYGSVGQSFRAPAVLELACADSLAACPLPFALGDDPPLDPVVATTFEIGGQWAVGPALLSGALYRSSVRDDIAFIQAENAVYEGYFANIGDTRREGFELSAQLFPSDRWSLYANYAWTHATYRTAVDIFSIRADDAFAGSPLAGENTVQPGSELPLIPRHQAKAGGSFRAASWLTLGLDLRYTGQQWYRGDEANETTPLDPTFVAGARAGVTLGPWEVNAVVNNVFNSHDPIFGTFNENRQTGELERFVTPMNARTVKLVVGRRFGGGGGDD